MSAVACPLRATRLGRGVYICEGFRIDHIGAGAAYGQAWHLTWPGERHPDAAYDTKAECLAQIAIELS